MKKKNGTNPAEKKQNIVVFGFFFGFGEFFDFSLHFMISHMHKSTKTSQIIEKKRDENEYNLVMNTKISYFF